MLPECSAALRALAVVLTKISNDLRWMASGPLAGLADIRLEALQPGSSIMPGKVNPVLPAAIAKRSYQEQRPVLDVALEETSLEREQLEALLDPLTLTGSQGE